MASWRIVKKIPFFILVTIFIWLLLWRALYLSQTIRLYTYLPNFEQPIYKPWVEDHLLVFMKGGMVGDVSEGGELVIRPIHTFAPRIGIGEKANHTKLLHNNPCPLPSSHKPIKITTQPRMLIHYSRNKCSSFIATSESYPQPMNRVLTFPI